MSKQPGPAPDYKTSDLYLAAYLQVAGVEMKRTERDPKSGKVQFVFDTSICSIDELKAAWFANTGKVVANQFAFAIKSLKSLVHSQ